MLFRPLPLLLGLLLTFLVADVPESQSTPGKTPSATAGKAPASQRDAFIDHNNGTVSDTTHGLMWKKCSEGQSWRKVGNGCEGKAAGMSWDDALNHVEIINAGKGFAGLRDWRVPTVKELATLVDYERPTPIDLSVFPGTPGLWYWSSTPYQRQGSRAWFVAFGSGDISIERIENQSLHLRMVRDTP